MSDFQFGVLMLGGPVDGMKIPARVGQRIIKCEVPDQNQLPLSERNPQGGFTVETVNYVIGVLHGTRGRVHYIATRNLNDCPIEMLVNGFKNPVPPQQFAQDMVPLLNGHWKGTRISLADDMQYVHVPANLDQLACYPHDHSRAVGNRYAGRDEDCQIVRLAGKGGKRYRVAVRDPQNECPIELLINGYRQSREVTA